MWHVPGVILVSKTNGWAPRFVEMRGRSIFDPQHYNCTQVYLLSALKVRVVVLSGEVLSRKRGVSQRAFRARREKLFFLRASVELAEVPRRTFWHHCAGVLERRDTPRVWWRALMRRESILPVLRSTRGFGCAIATKEVTELYCFRYCNAKALLCAASVAAVAVYARSVPLHCYLAVPDRMDTAG